MEFYCVPPLHAQTKWNYGQSISLQLVLGFDYQIHGFTHCIIFPGKKNVFCLYKYTNLLINLVFLSFIKKL